MHVSLIFMGVRVVAVHWCVSYRDIKGFGVKNVFLYGGSYTPYIIAGLSFRIFACFFFFFLTKNGSESWAKGLNLFIYLFISFPLKHHVKLMYPYILIAENSLFPLVSQSPSTTDASISF